MRKNEAGSNALSVLYSHQQSNEFKGLGEMMQAVEPTRVESKFLLGFHLGICNRKLWHLSHGIGEILIDMQGLACSEHVGRSDIDKQPSKRYLRALSFDDRNLSSDLHSPQRRRHSFEEFAFSDDPSFPTLHRP